MARTIGYRTEYSSDAGGLVSVPVTDTEFLNWWNTLPGSTAEEKYMATQDGNRLTSLNAPLGGTFEVAHAANKLGLLSPQTILGDPTYQEAASRSADRAWKSIPVLGDLGIHPLVAIGAAMGAGGLYGGTAGAGAAAASPFAEMALSAPALGGVSAEALGAGLGSAAVGGTAATPFTGGLTGTVTGAPGLSGTALGAPGINPALAGAEWGFTGMGGLGTAGVGGAVAAPSLFGATEAAPVAGGGAGAAAGGAGAASTGLGSILSNPAIVGAGIGALAGGLGGGGQAGSIQVEEGIPDWLMPYVKPTLDRYSTEVQNYNVDPYGIMPSAMKEFQNTISGMYLDPSTNKYLEDYFRLGSERIKGALSPSFGHMQAFGQHSGYNEALSRGLGDFSVGLYGGAYERERDRQNQMVGNAPAFLGQSSTANFAPYQQYLSTVGSLGKKKEEPYFTNPFGNIMGGALFGSQIGSAFR